MKERVIRWASERARFIIIVEIVILFSLAITFCLYKFGIEKTYKLAGILTPIAVMCVTIYFALNQLNLGKGQKALSQRQASTAHTKLKLDLFDKRYEAYQNIIEHFVYCYDLPMGIMAYLSLSKEENEEYYSVKSYGRAEFDRNKFIQPIRERATRKIEEIAEYNVESKKKRELDLERIRFLYSDEVYHILFGFSKECHELLGHQHRTLIVCLSREVDSFLGIPTLGNPNMADIEGRKSKLAIELKTKIVDTMRPFLHVPDQ